MPSMSTSREGSIITWKLISTGTAIVLAAVFILWLARTAAGERALLEQQRLNEMAAESRALCEKWGMPAGSPKFAACAADIQAVRDSQLKRMTEDSEPF